MIITDERDRNDCDCSGSVKHWRRVVAELMCNHPSLSIYSGRIKVCHNKHVKGNMIQTH